MNIYITQYVKRGTMLTGLVLSSLVLASCTMTATTPQGAEDARSKLTALQSDPILASHARVELREAETAVRSAEQPLPEADAALGQHRVYIADRTVSIAEAKATTRYAEDQRVRLGEERDAARLRARTLEVVKAREEAARARSAADAAQSSEATAAAAAAQQRAADQRQLDAAQSSEAAAAATAAQKGAEYQRQINALQAEITDRGVVLTLGDVLFATASADLQRGANGNLDKLVSFLNEYPKRRVQIEGHTDNVGSGEYNQNLSQRRADSVQTYLTQQGIASQRLTASGIGMEQPVANNGTASGRQQNRRVEIIIENPARS